MMQVTIRPARPEDYPAIARLTVAAYRTDGQLEAGNPYREQLADVAGRADAGELLVAADPGTGQLLGAVLFVRPGSRFAELSGPDEAEFRMLAVDPAAQGRGVGEALARACLDRAAGLGCRAVVLFARDFAEAAQRLYARLGFVRTPGRDWSPFAGVQLLALRRELSTPQRVGPADGSGPVGSADPQ